MKTGDDVTECSYYADHTDADDTIGAMKRRKACYDDYSDSESHG